MLDHNLSAAAVFLRRPSSRGDPESVILLDGRGSQHVWARFETLILPLPGFKCGKRHGVLIRTLSLIPEGVSEKGTIVEQRVQLVLFVLHY